MVDPKKKPDLTIIMGPGASKPEAEEPEDNGGDYEAMALELADALGVKPKDAKAAAEVLRAFCMSCFAEGASDMPESDD